MHRAMAMHLWYRNVVYLLRGNISKAGETVLA